MLSTLLFYLFSFGVLGSGVMVITRQNPVHAVLFLIFAFFNSAGLFVLLGAEFIAMLMVIVYVGAVAVLFLFVVMMLNVQSEQMRRGFIRNLPVGLMLAVLLFIELFLTFKAVDHTKLALAKPDLPIWQNVTNTKAIGEVLYTQYIYPFQVAGLILLVAMIGAIVLTLRSRPGVKKQRISEQVNRTREESIEVVKVTIGEGV